MYAAYATAADYADLGSGAIPDDELDRRLITSSRHIDSLTFNRIVGQGFDRLTVFQKDLVKEAVCLQADFEYENADEIDTMLSSYSINGVSAQFGEGWNVMVQNGIATRKDTYELLKQTGLTCRTLRRWHL